jgi:hypothetical protein
MRYLILSLFTVFTFNCGISSPPADMVVYDFDHPDYEEDEGLYEEFFPPPPEESYSGGPVEVLPPKEDSDGPLDRFIKRPRPSPPPCVVCGMVK